jgi:hypothetical protein
MRFAKFRADEDPPPNRVKGQPISFYFRIVKSLLPTEAPSRKNSTL